jgi:adenosylcobinamide-GDP ribazoletransferase
VKHELRLFLLALQFFTRVPIPRWVGFEADWLTASARHFPLVGALVGLFAAGMLWLAAQVFPPFVAVGVSMLATIMLTGAFHEDGLADTFDALGGAVSRERALEIMKDSRIGSYGAVSLVLMLGLKAGTLASLPLPVAMAALVLAHAASRAAAVALIRCLPYAGDVSQAKARPMTRGLSGWGISVALGWVLLAVSVAFSINPSWWPPLGLSLLLAMLGTLLCGRWLHRRLGGITGDTLGATQQITELMVLMGWLAWVPWAGRVA